MSEGTRTYLPQFCDHCQASIVHGAGFGQSDPWRAAIVVVNVAMFQVAAGRPQIHARCAQTEQGADANDLSLVLVEIGCLGCYLPKALAATIDELRERGLSWLAQETKDADRMEARVTRLKSADP